MEIMAKQELYEFLLAVIAASLIFSIPNFSRWVFYFFTTIVILFPRVIVEKFVANKFKGKSTFRFNLKGALVGILISFFGIRLTPVFSTELYGYKFGRWNRKSLWLNSKEIGIISLASTLLTLSIGIFFYLIEMKDVALMNIWIAISTLLPFKGLDGEKLLQWDWGVWSFIFIASLIILILWI